MDVAVDGWYCETHDGHECRFVCVQYSDFGFSLSEKQVAELVEKITALLAKNEFITAPDDLLHVDWSHNVGERVMIAFRPVRGCERHYYDFPRITASRLVQKLQRVLKGNLSGSASDCTSNYIFRN